MHQYIRIFLKKFKEYIVLVILLIISLFLITLNDNSKVKSVRVYTLGVFSSINSAISSLSTLFENTQYIEALEKRNADLMLQINELRRYGLEHEQLNNILDFKSESNYEFLTARIVSRLISKVSGYFIISKGSSDGIESGLPVITDKGLLGIILDVSENFASVRTYENSLFKVAIKIERSNVDGVLNWDGKNLLIKNVPTTYDVEVGDRVLVSELSSILPPEIPIGIITEKETTLSGVLSNLVVKPFVNLTDTRNVIVLKIKQEHQLDSLSQVLIGGDK